jgi:hypothetical protein
MKTDYKKIFNHFLIALSLTSITLMSSCSLFKVDLNTGVEPLPAKELNTRILMHEFGIVFSNKVEQLADSIMKTTKDKDIKMNALYWKINAIAMSRQVIFQTVPYASLVDTWTFCKQQSDFVRVGNGSDLFGDFQPRVIEVAGKLEEKVSMIARAVSTGREYNSYEKFVNEYAALHPFEDVYFNRGSILSELNKSLGIPDSVAVKTVGTMPETMSDLSSRINDMADKVPKMAKWKTEAYLYESGVDSLDVKALMDSINMLAGQISYIAENSPELLDSAIMKLNEELTPLVNKLDRRWGETLWKLGNERMALMESLDEQRVALSETLAEERAVIMSDLQLLSKDLVELSWVHIKQLLFKALFLILLILIVMLGLPFGLGYVTGKTLARRKLEKNQV